MPPLERPMAWLCVPLLRPVRGGGDLDDGGVDHGVFEVRVVRAGLEKAPENPGFDPIAISLEDTGPLAKVGRQVTLRAACPHNPKHRLDEAAVVAAAAAGGRRLTQAMQLHLRPLGVRQYKAFHPKLESQPRSQGYPESQQTLDGLRAKEVVGGNTRSAI